MDATARQCRAFQVGFTEAAMTKRLLISLISMTVLFALPLAAAAGVNPVLPGGGWWTGSRIQNVGLTTVDVDMTAYDSASTSTYTATKSATAGGSVTFQPADFAGMPTGFIGSGIVSAAEPIRAVVNVTNRLSGGNGIAGGLAAAQYQGATVVDTTLNFPIVKNDYFAKTTTFYVQNAGGSAATATASFLFAGTTYTYTTPSIAPGAMVSFTAADSRDLSMNPPPSGTSGQGSLAVTSTTDLAGVVIEHKTTENPSTVAQAIRGFTPGDYDTTVYAPTNKNDYFGRFTGLRVMNVSGGSINVSVSYTTRAGGACTGGTYPDGTTGLAANASFTFPSSAFPAGCSAAAVVTATGNIVAAVNESYTNAWLVANPTRTQESVTYAALPDVSVTTKISIPGYKENSYGKGSGLTVMNVGGLQATNVVFVFTGPTGVYTSVAQTIDSMAAMNVTDARLKAGSWWNGTAMTPAALGGCPADLTGCGANGSFGVIITADQPIVAIANESTYPFTAPLMMQDKNNYEGFNLTP
jgi:hypothetical protein